MTIHIGNRAKLLVDNNWKGSKKDFAKQIGLKQITYLFKLFKKEDIGTDVLKRMASVLNIDFILFFTDQDTNNSSVQEPMVEYSKNAQESTNKIHITHLKEKVQYLEKEIVLLEGQVKLYEKLMNDTKKIDKTVKSK